MGDEPEEFFDYFFDADPRSISLKVSIYSKFKYAHKLVCCGHRSMFLITGSPQRLFSTKLVLAWGSWNYHKVIEPLELVSVHMYLFYLTVEVPDNVLVKSLLDTKGVYILDCHADVFVW